MRGQVFRVITRKPIVRMCYRCGRKYESYCLRTGICEKCYKPSGRKKCLGK